MQLTMHGLSKQKYLTDSIRLSAMQRGDYSYGNWELLVKITFFRIFLTKDSTSFASPKLSDVGLKSSLTFLATFQDLGNQFNGHEKNESYRPKPCWDQGLVWPEQ